MSLTLFRIPGFLTPGECMFIRRAMDLGAVEDAEVLLAGARPRTDVRRALLVDPAPGVISDVERRLERCRRRVGTALGLVPGAREGPGFIRYPAGGFYKPHVDRVDDPHWAPASRRAIAVVVFLNSSRQSASGTDFEGGALRLHVSDGTLDVVPETGLLVAFRADTLHEVTEVRGGVRDTIVDWFYEGP